MPKMQSSLCLAMISSIDSASNAITKVCEHICASHLMGKYGNMLISWLFTPGSWHWGDVIVTSPGEDIIVQPGHLGASACTQAVQWWYIFNKCPTAWIPNDLYLINNFEHDHWPWTLRSLDDLSRLHCWDPNRLLRYLRLPSDGTSNKGREEAEAFQIGALFFFGWGLLSSSNSESKPGIWDYVYIYAYMDMRWITLSHYNIEPTWKSW